MVKNPRSEEEKIKKDIRNLFKLKKEIKGIKDRIHRDIKNIFEHEKEKEHYYKPVRANNIWSNNYISDKNRMLSVVECINKIRLCLKGIINNLKRI